MKVDELYRDVDRRHVIMLFDLFCSSEYNPFAMLKAYSRLWERKRADDGEEYFILKQPIQLFHEILRKETIPLKQEDPDVMIFHWMADIYLYALYQLDIPFECSVKLVQPEWLYQHYYPLHETSIKNGWEKAQQICKNDYCYETS